MSYISMDSTGIATVLVDYLPATPHGILRVIPASVRLRMKDTDGSQTATVFLDMDLVRQLAESLPDLVMTHDAEERAAKEQAKAKAEAV
ncbi:hypothetical protein ACFWPK_13345 [Nocardia sp. NPDC058519]|uniref:hypothetical protein n=1 Tax=Nocardia sp. NPDC058519 TaxID=3346535 RepID=UPI0036496E8D